MNQSLSRRLYRQTIWILISLLFLDLAFILLHIVVATTDWLPSLPKLLISEDRGYAEKFQYLKLLIVVLGLGWLAVQRRSRIFFAWSMIFLYILLDDALTIHERGGGVLDRTLQLPEVVGLRGQDLGELIIFATMGIISLVSLVVAYKTDYSTQNRRASVYLLGLLLIFSVLAGIVDILHIAVNSVAASLWLDVGFTVLEDGGELVIVSLIVIFVCRLLKPDVDSRFASKMDSKRRGKFL